MSQDTSIPARPRRFEGDFQTQIALPLGGLGAGCVSFNGQGGLQDWAIRNRPHLSCERAWGTIEYTASTCGIDVIEGRLEIEKLIWNETEVEWRQSVTPEKNLRIGLTGAAFA